MSMHIYSLATPLRYLRRKGLETLLFKMCTNKNTWLALRHVTGIPDESRQLKKMKCS